MNLPGTEPILRLEKIQKRYPGVVALRDVSVTVQAGEVLAVCGENGAGKSTLMKLIAGVVQPDAGQMFWEGEAVTFASPAEAIARGVSLIHQELSLAENLTVLENLFLGRETTTAGWFGWCLPDRMTREGTRWLARVGLPESLLSLRISSLSPGQKQLVEIARAIGQEARLLIMDEPTSSLTHAETDRLYQVIDQLKLSGVTILYISHRLAEITRCADRVVVLRDGQVSGWLSRDELTHQALVRLMVGRELNQYFPRTRPPATDATVLELTAVQYTGAKAAADLTLRRGEILGMAGLIGSGRTELAETVFGLRNVVSGEIRLNGQPLRIRQPQDAVRAGILLIPEDRRQHGLIVEATVGQNLSWPNLDRFSQFLGWLPGHREAAFHARAIQALGIKTPHAQQTVGFLSGGNQQKVVFAKWLERAPQVLILDEPTRGVDVGAKAEIYTLMDQLCAAGTAIWMISSDMEELLGLSDRITVMHEGRLSPTRPRSECTEEIVMTLAVGGTV